MLCAGHGHPLEGAELRKYLKDLLRAELDAPHARTKCWRAPLSRHENAGFGFASGTTEQLYLGQRPSPTTRRAELGPPMLKGLQHIHLRDAHANVSVSPRSARLTAGSSYRSRGYERGAGPHGRGHLTHARSPVHKRPVLHLVAADSLKLSSLFGTGRTYLINIHVQSEYESSRPCVEIVPKVTPL